MQGSCVPKGIFKILPRRAPGTERDLEESVTYGYVTQEGLGEIPGTKVDLDLSKGLNENPEGLTLRKEARIPGAAGITSSTVQLGDVLAATRRQPVPRAGMGDEEPLPGPAQVPGWV